MGSLGRGGGDAPCHQQPLCDPRRVSCTSLYLETVPGCASWVQSQTAACPPPRDTPSDSSGESRLSPALLSYWLHIRGPHDPSLGSINLLELLTEPRETHLLISLQIYCSRRLNISDQQPDEEIHRVRSQARSAVLMEFWGPAWWHLEVSWFLSLEAL